MTWKPYDPCPCGCGVIGWKLKAKKTCCDAGCVVGCNSASCRNRRNQKKGKAGQAKMHTRLGGTGFTPHHEESARPYLVECLVMPESKEGEQIPAAFDKFTTSEWFRHALRQSERAIPEGSGARPCVVIRGEYAIIDIRVRTRTVRA